MSAPTLAYEVVPVDPYVAWVLRRAAWKRRRLPETTRALLDAVDRALIDRFLFGAVA